MKIAGGALRGRSLRVPRGVRPTGGQAREALFSVWSARLGGSRFLDLFAGSGAVGIEALSRGAASCVAVEGAGAVFRALRANYETVAAEHDRHLVRARLPRGLGGEEVGKRAPFDLVFADPPYDYSDWPELLEAVAPLLRQGAELAVEHGRRNRPPEDGGGLELLTRRAYGETEISFYERGEPLEVRAVRGATEVEAELFEKDPQVDRLGEDRG